jgi:hypothetical protein
MKRVAIECNRVRTLQATQLMTAVKPIIGMVGGSVWHHPPFD